MQKQRTFIYLFSLFFMTACQSETDERLSLSLELAGDNRPELEKVLEHYKSEPLKLHAAQFLIANMPGHIGYDRAVMEKLQPVYDKHVALSEKYDWKRPVEWQKEINGLWDKVKINISRYPIPQDVNTIKTDWLIGEIELAFKVWRENAYTRDAPFDDFCRYILPYRFNDKFGLDNNRQEFYDRHHGLYSDRSHDFRVITDSLHFLYSTISHSAGAAGSMPIYNIATYERLKRGLCEDQTYFNAHLMSALGMAVAIDFVPGWGNRTNGHSWNALLVDGKTYPFEPFWDKERWKYDRIYNNETFDLQYGRFRLPKVYRHTFEFYLDGPMTDTKEDKKNIPALFTNPRIKDVSTAYFKTSDVSIRLTETIPGNTNYCYLCVYEAKNMTWTPVQWGKIVGDKVVFKDMGRNMVYLPAFYQYGDIIPAAPVFILDGEGTCERLKCNGKTQEVTTNTTTPLGSQYDKLLSGARLTGCDALMEEGQEDLLYELNDTLDICDNNFKLHSEKTYRYLCLNSNRDTIALNEISFYEKQGEEVLRISDVKVLFTPDSYLTKGTEKVTDYLSGTGYFGSYRTDKRKKNKILFDLGKQYTLHSFSVIPFPEYHINGDGDYTLYYWDNTWKPVEKVKGSDDFITFKQVPSGALYLIKCSIPVKGTYSNERIFTYADGSINWW